jgi:ABC-2 type transport system ATP-binding protein
LRDVQQHHGVTVLLTTHLLEEAEKADRLAILDEGRLICVSTPAALRDSLGGDCLNISTENLSSVQQTLRESLQLESQIIDGRLRLELPDGHTWIERILSAAGNQIREISLGKPSLEDAFISLTGHRFDVKAEKNRAGSQEKHSR